MPYDIPDDVWAKMPQNIKDDTMSSYLARNRKPAAVTPVKPVATVAAPAKPVPTASNISGTAADTALSGVSPLRQQVNSLLDSLKSKVATPAAYNPDTDTDFQTAKNELVKQANTAYGNTNAEYLGNQSGNFNSAAQQIASSAQNDLLKKIPEMQQEYEDRYNTQQQQNISNTNSIVNTLLGLDDSDYNRSQNTIASTGTMSMDDILSSIPQNSSLRSTPDFSIAIKNSKDPWEKAQLEALRYQKIMNDPALKAKYGATAVIPTYQTQTGQINAANIASKQAEADANAAEVAAKLTTAQTNADKAAYEKALDTWKASGTATKSVASVLGIPSGAKTADYNMDQINSAISQMNANTSRMNANTNAKNATTSRMNAESTISGKKTTNNQSAISNYSKYIDSVFMAPIKVGSDANGNPVYSSQKQISNRTALEDYLGSLVDQGVDDAVVNSLASKYGVTNDLMARLTGK